MIEALSSCGRMRSDMSFQLLASATAPSRGRRHVARRISLRKCTSRILILTDRSIFDICYVSAQKEGFDIRWYALSLGVLVHLAISHLGLLHFSPLGLLQMTALIGAACAVFRRVCAPIIISGPTITAV